MPTASSLTLSTNGFVQQLQQQQAQRSAEQANQSAQSLQSQARAARLDAARAQQAARELEIQAGQAQARAASVNIGIKAAAAIETSQADLQTAYDRLPAQIAAAQTDTYTIPSATSSVSTANVGTVVNTTA
ncbi:MAG: hypothetical protein PHH36_11155 [Sideroxydans sp.]|nr:hypothetical protein [Sideroxydans sp.]